MSQTIADFFQVVPAKVSADTVDHAARAADVEDVKHAEQVTKDYLAKLDKGVEFASLTGLAMVRIARRNRRRL